MNSLYRLKPYIAKYKWAVVVGSICLVIANVVAMVVPWMVKDAINAIEAGLSASKLAKYALIILGLTLVQGVFRFFMRRVLIGVSRRIEYDLRNDFFSHIQKLSFSFYNRTSTGDLMARATNDLNSVRDAVGPGFMYSFTTIVSIIAGLYWMVRIDLVLTLVSLALLPILGVLVNKMGRAMHQAYRKVQDHFSTMSSMVQENLSGIRVVKAYGQEENEIDRFSDLSREYVHLNMHSARLSAMFRPLLRLVATVVIVAVLWAGGLKVISGALTLGGLVAFMVYLGMLTWPMLAAGWVVNLFQRGAASMARINAIMEAAPDITDGPRTLPIKEIDGDIKFENVSFSYNGSQVLDKVNLLIPKGRTVAIVGRTGSGKSTLVNLIPRFFDPKEGSVTIGGVDLRRVPVAVLRSGIGYVPQETFLFSDTIEANIAYGLAEKDLARVEEAADIASLSGEVEEFPDKYQTLLGERGVNLSGGQKQRTAISRAVVLRPKILILDDSLSSVDADTEVEILKGLSAHNGSRTTVIVSHRISSVINADEILVMDKGAIAERGTHARLIAAGGVYAAMYRKQLLTAELEAMSEDD
jgi:ATP-binding cassette subfamily B multidrug efflux pump